MTGRIVVSGTFNASILPHNACLSITRARTVLVLPLTDGLGGTAYKSDTPLLEKYLPLSFSILTFGLLPFITFQS